MKPAFVARRLQELQAYFTEIVRISQVVNSKEFNAFIKPTDKIVSLARAPTAPAMATRDQAPELPRVQPLHQHSHAEVEKTCQRLVEDVASFFINLASKSNPLEEDDVSRKRREYASLLQTMTPVSWGASALSAAAPSSEASVDSSVLDWVKQEAVEVCKAFSSSQIVEVTILSRPV
jgi:hypothetical protein